MKEKEITKIKEIEEIIHETRKWAFNVMGDEYMEQMHKRKKEEDYGSNALWRCGHDGRFPPAPFPCIC